MADKVCALHVPYMPWLVAALCVDSLIGTEEEKQAEWQV